MTLVARKIEGTGFVEVYDGDKPVAGPFTSDEGAVWIENQTKPKESSEEEVIQETVEFNPVGIL